MGAEVTAAVPSMVFLRKDLLEFLFSDCFRGYG